MCIGSVLRSAWDGILLAAGARPGIGGEGLRFWAIKSGPLFAIGDDLL